MQTPNLTEQSNSSEGIRTTDAQMECPSVQPTVLIRNFPLGTDSKTKRTLYHMYSHFPSSEAMSQSCGPWAVEQLRVLTGL